MKGKGYLKWRPVLAALAVGMIAYGLSLHGAPAGQEPSGDLGGNDVVVNVGGVPDAGSAMSRSETMMAAPREEFRVREAIMISAEPAGGASALARGTTPVGGACDCDAECVEPGADECLVAACINGVCAHRPQLVGNPCDLDGLYCTRDECMLSGEDVVCVAKSDGAGGALSPCAKTCVGGDNAGNWCYEAEDCPAGSCMPRSSGGATAVCNETEDWCELSTGMGRCCNGLTCSLATEASCTGGGGKWLRIGNPDDLGHCWCPEYGSGIAPRGDETDEVAEVIGTYKICTYTEDACYVDNDCRKVCDDGNYAICDDNDDCDAGISCIANPCVADVDQCQDGYLTIGDDYSLESGKAMRLNEFRFRGGAQDIGEAMLFMFFDANGLFVDSFSATMGLPGIHYYGYGIDCYPDCDINPDNGDSPENPPFVIPAEGFVVMRGYVDSTDHETTTSATWASTDAVDIGLNDAAEMWWDIGAGEVTGDFPDLATDILAFELVGQVIDSGIQPEGACCTVDGAVGVCNNTYMWECGICAEHPETACSWYRDCPPGDYCTFKNWFGPTSHDDLVGGVTEDCATFTGCTVGACCAADGSCTPDTTPGDCDTAGGTFLGFATSCEPNCCPPPDTETGADAACDVWQCHDGTDWVDPYDMCGPSDPDDPDCDTGAGETCTLRVPGPTEYPIAIPAFGAAPNTFTFMGDASGHDPYFTEVDGDDCNLGGEVDDGWYEAFVIVNNDADEFDCAIVTIDFCCTDPIQTPVYIVMKDCCPCPGGICWVTLDQNPDGTTKSGWGPDCDVEVDGVDHCCQDDNFTGQFMVPSGRYSWQIPSGMVCDDTTYDCQDDDDCQPGVPCVSTAGPYTGHVTVEECPRAACCLNLCVGGTNDGEYCEDDAGCPGGACNNVCEIRTKLTCEDHGGDFLSFDTGTVVTCAASPCATGACCTGAGTCEDGAAYDTEVECEAAGGVYHGYVQCDEHEPCDVCPFLTATNCKEDDDDGFIVISDRANEVRIADDFRPAGTQIGELCWTAGYYGGGDGVGNFECADAPPPDNWVVRFYQDAAGVPGAEVGTPGGQTLTILASNQHGGGSRLWDYAASIPTAVFVTPGECYWMELTGMGEGPTGCHTYWSTALEGNDYSMRDNLDYGNYGPEDVDNLDMIFCVDTGLSGTSDCGDILAACCTCPGCTPDLTQEECVDDLEGVWRLGNTCATAACPDVAPYNEECDDAETDTAADTWVCRGGTNDGNPCDIANVHGDCPDDGDDIGYCVAYRIVGFENVCAARENTANPPTECGGTGNLRYDIWYQYTAPGTGEFKVSMCPSDVCDGALWDTMVAIYDSDTCPMVADDEMLCGDDECDSAGPSEITVSVTSGQTYTVRIGGWSAPLNYGNPRGWGEVEFSFIDGDAAYEPPVAAPAPENGPKNRYISIRSANVGSPVALQVIVASSQYFPDSVGETKYVGAQTPSGYYPLIETPLLQVWPEEDLHIFDCMIHPVATFEVRAGDGAGTWSDPLVIATITKPGGKNHGDIVGSFTGTWQPPEGNMSMNDLMAALQAFGNAATAPPKHWADVHDDGPNQLVNMSDVLLLVNAFGGSAYPYNPGTAAVPCS